MPLPMKTLSEAAQLLGIPEKEIKAMVDMGKIRAVMRNGVPRFAPDEIAKLSRQRKTLPESAKK
jgi:excisionase family DNA binding protein